MSVGNSYKFEYFGTQGLEIYSPNGSSVMFDYLHITRDNIKDLLDGKECTIKPWCSREVCCNQKECIIGSSTISHGAVGHYQPYVSLSFNTDDRVSLGKYLNTVMQAPRARLY